MMPSEWNVSGISRISTSLERYVIDDVKEQKVYPKFKDLSYWIACDI